MTAQPLRFAFAGVLGAVILGAALTALPRGQAEDAKPADDWPVFRGDAWQSGVARSTLPHPLETRWKFKTQDAIEGTAAICDGVVYVGSLDGHLYALDLATGKEKWRYKAGPVRVAAAAKNGAVYVGDLDGLFHCVDAVTGKARWTFDTKSEITSGANFAADDVLFGCGNEHLYCLTKDGTQRWKFKIAGGPVLGTPAVGGGRTFVTGCDSKMHVIDLANGNEVLAVDLEAQTGATPAVAGDHLFVGTMAKNVLALDWKKGEITWIYEPAKRANDFYASAAVTDNLVIAGSRDKRIHAIDRKSGAERWTFTTKAHVDASPVVVGDRVYAGSLDGNLYVLGLARGDLLQQLRLGKGIMASPAGANNLLVIGTVDGEVIALGGK
jgi:outer membrane protein assembly factor BamB